MTCSSCNAVYRTLYRVTTFADHWYWYVYVYLNEYAYLASILSSRYVRLYIDLPCECTTVTEEPEDGRVAARDPFPPSVATRIWVCRV
jgi:hypothetical protein